MPSRQRSVWAGRVAFVAIMAGLIAYLWVVGLDRADKLGSSISCVLALAALTAPYLLHRARPAETAPDAAVHDAAVRDSGEADADCGGIATSGIEISNDQSGSTRVTRSGKALARGAGSVANTGIRQAPRP